MTFFLLFLTVYGLTFVLVHSKIFGLDYLPLRKWLCKVWILRDWISCSFCVSFWMGLVVWLACIPADFSASGVINMLTFALASASACYFLDTAISRLER